jgi:hypothetical protein
MPFLKRGTSSHARQLTTELTTERTAGGFQRFPVAYVAPDLTCGY